MNPLVAILFLGILIVVIYFTFKGKKNITATPADTSPHSPQLKEPDLLSVDPITGETKMNIYFDKSTGSVGTYLIFDVETTGLPNNYNATPKNVNNWPRVVQIAWILLDDDFKEVNFESHYLKQEKPIPEAAIKIHHIDDAVIAEKGEDPASVFEYFLRDVGNTIFLIAHNIAFDSPIVEAEMIRLGYKKPFDGRKKICTMKYGAKYCEIPKQYGRGYKYPKLEELVRCCLLNSSNRIELNEIHDARVDTMLTAKCFVKMRECGFLDVGYQIYEFRNKKPNPDGKF